MLKDKFIVLGVCGGIPAYKAADLARKLAQEGARVQVVMTRSALEFITPLTFYSLSRQRVITDLFDPALEWSAPHVELGRRAEVVVIAPATANTIAKLASGLADDVLTCTVLATKAPVIMAPAMNLNMYENQATQENLSRLKARGFTIVGPEVGPLADGTVGPGRMAEVEDIIGTISWVLGKKGDLAGRKIVVTAGGTIEPIDPVRHVSNPSSGKMGYALAEAARDRGAQVTLISAPTSLRRPACVELVQVTRAVEMGYAVLMACAGADALLMAAAVSDYAPAKAAAAKIKKGPERLTLDLVRTPDILSEVKGVLKVGFAAETEDLVANAREKLERKGLDLIVANDVASGFATDTNKVVIIDRQGQVESLSELPKREVAHRVLDRVVRLLSGG